MMMSACRDFSHYFVRIPLRYSASQHTYCWGLLIEVLNEFIPIWSDNWSAVRTELGTMSNGLLPEEMEQMIYADSPDANTPDEAWAALAYFKLTDGKLLK
jgi:hypothetical protein